MNNSEFNNYVKQALVLETRLKTKFLNGIRDKEIRQKIEFIISDNTQATDFVIKTFAGLKPFEGLTYSEFAAGDKIKQFTIIKLLATGGMGLVYLAYDNQLKRNVALKTIRPEFLLSQEGKQRFKTEARILSSMNHPSICQIYDFIEGHKSDILVLELLNGKTLDHLKIQQKEKLNIFIQIVSALEKAHEKGIIHRDLKPDNIMMTKEGIVKILDFGISKSTIHHEKTKYDFIEETPNEINNLTKAGTLMGTLLYMSPEQAKTEDITVKSDVYSLGIIMQEILTGKYTYNLIDTKNLKKQIINAEFINTALIPKQYKDLIRRMTDKKPEDRPAISDVKNDLLKIENLPRQKKKKNIIFSVTALILAMVIFSTLQYNKSQKNKTSHELTSSFKDKTHALSTTLEKIYTLPVHDISNDLLKLSTKKEKLLTEIKQSQLSETLKDLYLGHVYFGFNEYKKALPFLNKSWPKNQNNKELNSQLIFSHLMVYYNTAKENFYQKGFQDNYFLQNLKREHIDPALKFMRNKNNDLQVNSIPQALLKWQKKDFTQAIEILKTLTSEQQWHYQAYELLGEILVAQAKDYHNSDQTDLAIQSFTESLATYKQASIRGRSYAIAYQEICELNWLLLDLVTDRFGDNHNDYYQQGISNCTTALKIKPNDQRIHFFLAQLYNRQSGLTIQKGQDPTELLAKALENSQKTTGEKKQIVEAETYTYLGMYQKNTGKNPIDNYTKALRAYDRILAHKKDTADSYYFNIMFIAFMKLNYESTIGVNPQESIQKILELYKKAEKSQQTSNNSKSKRNLVVLAAYTIQASYFQMQNKNPQQFVEQAQKYTDICNKLDSKSPNCNSVLLKAYLSEIIYTIKQASNPIKQLEKAHKLSESIMVIQPKHSGFIEIKAALLTQQQLANRINNPDYSIDFSSAISLFEQAIKLNPKLTLGYYRFADMHLNKARYSNNKQEQIQSIKRGIELCDSALNIDNNSAHAYFTKAKLLTLGIELKLYQQNEFAQAKALLAKAQSINPLLR